MTIETLTFNNNLFTSIKPVNYLFNAAKFSNTFKVTDNLYIPVVTDSEWVDHPIKQFLANKPFTNRDLISTQFKQAFSKPLIFFTDYALKKADKALKKTKYNYCHFSSDFVLIDYLKQFNMDSYIDEYADLKQSEILTLPILHIYAYSFFGLVDYPLMFAKNSCLYDWYNKEVANKVIEQDKRLSVKGTRDSIEVDFNKTVMYINDSEGNKHAYRLKFCFIDVSAINGKASYKETCANVGINIEDDKKLMDNYKTDMLKGLIEQPDLFIRYALNDLESYNIWLKYNELMQKVYNALDIGDFFKGAKLTMGSTVADVFKYASYDKFNFKPKNNRESKPFNDRWFIPSNAQTLRQDVNKSYVFFTGKVSGGRCHNNNPLFISSEAKPIIESKHDTIFYTYDIEDIKIDNDFAGFYGAIMQKSFAFYGTPWVYNGYDKLISLKSFLKKYENKFDDKHLLIIVSTVKDDVKRLKFDNKYSIYDTLSFNQDFLLSWLDAKTESVPIAPKTYIDVIDYKSGESKLFKRQVINAPITSNELELINLFTPAKRNELLSKLKVIAAIGYEKDKEVKLDDFASYDDLMSNIDDSVWIKINLGDLLIDRLIESRAHHRKLAKQYENKADIENYLLENSLQNMYKLIINTLFGNSGSKHFKTSNPLLANNITSTARLCMYLTEKVSNLLGSITDGSIGGLHWITMRDNRKFYLDHMADFSLMSYKERDNKNFTLKLLGGGFKSGTITFRESGLIKDGDNVTYNSLDYTELRLVKDDNENLIITGYENIKTFIEDRNIQHLRNLFPQFNILNNLSFSIKDIYTLVKHHGAANYHLENNHLHGKNKSVTKKRSYKNVESISLHLDDNDDLIAGDFYKNNSVPKKFFECLNNGKCPKLPIAIRTDIIKTGEYVIKNLNSKSDLITGDSTVIVETPNYFSPSQFTFLYAMQRSDFIKIVTQLKNKYGDSIEGYFTDKNGLVNIPLMLNEVYHIIENDLKPIEYLKKKYVYNHTLERLKVKRLASTQRNDLLYYKESAIKKGLIVETKRARKKKPANDEQIDMFFEHELDNEIEENNIFAMM